MIKSDFDNCDLVEQNAAKIFIEKVSFYFQHV